MRIYTAHYRPGRPLDGDGLVLVREGFAWWALLVPPLWALYHRLWLVALLFVILSSALSLAVPLLHLDTNGASLAMLGLNLLFAMSANDLRRWTLGRRGYRELGVVGGRDIGAAEQRLIDLSTPLRVWARGAS
ncbi:DUF2628 domain-containing protein [Oceanibacterium hippocampi]|uniref:DUF2628 domain-containing protein n=1 Tax=Oceanibacterium hippocampi TaxID=745714 RepID=A0A1Y5RKE2_9PROT|nr:DUF2628 domain-containing protein [Oceanibacterium hippocampi]SLN18433.1 hypothetical protein OCH7691_00393 [Oceanibacterium hippocampi]